MINNPWLQILLSNKEYTLLAIRTINTNLRESRILDFLRSRGNIQLFNPAQYAHEQAHKAAFSAGYHQCLNDIELFVQTIIEPIEQLEQAKSPTEYYGALDILVKEKKVTEEEAEHYRNKGTWPTPNPK